MNAQDPQLLIEIRIGSSGDLLRSFDRRELDTVIVRLHAGRSDGERLAEESFGWFAAPGWRRRSGRGRRHGRAGCCCIGAAHVALWRR